MNIIKSNFLVALVLIPILGCGSSLMASEAQERPKNVILMLIDDMGYGDLGVHGNPVIKTPNMDALHNGSARFTNFAVSLTCAPTRAALMTGRHEFKSDVIHTIGGMNILNKDATTIADLFQRKGFVTGLFGKWHLAKNSPTDENGPWSRGFDETLTVAWDNQGRQFDPKMLKNREATQFKGYRTDILFDEAMSFIENNKDKPFFCYLPTYSPHAPLNVPEKYSQPYKDLGKLNEKEANFCGMVANVDENVGRLMSRLESLKLAENTLVILINDNGATYGLEIWNAGMRGAKGTAWRGGTRALSFWKCGSLYPAGDRGQMTGHVDVFSTLADLFNLDIDEKLAAKLDGDSLQPLLKDATATLAGERMQVYHKGRWGPRSNWKTHKYAHCSVRWKSYQLVRIEPCEDPSCCKNLRLRASGKRRPIYTANKEHYQRTKMGQWELYNIEDDPYQNRDLANEKPEVVTQMTQFYEAWWEDLAPTLEAAAAKDAAKAAAKGKK